MTHPLAAEPQRSMVFMPFAFMIFSLIALIATLSVTEVVRLFAHRLSAVDTPGGRRAHRRPTARLGGLGIYWGFYVALGLATYGHPLWGDAFHGDDPGMIGMMVGSSLLLLVGVMDDIYQLKATLKLGFQVLAALLLYGFGWRVEAIGLPGIAAIPVGPLSLPLTLGWVLLATNAVNLIDGLDGLACGIALVATVAICAILAPIGGPLMLAAAALAGALVGFLWFNLNPALIFMGDAGSLFVGFVLAAMTMRAGQLAETGTFPIIPGLLLAVPLFDTTFAIARRSRAAARLTRGVVPFLREARSRVFAPDGMHIHHRLIRAGFSTRRAVTLLWGVAMSFALVGYLLVRDRIQGSLLLVVVLVLWWRGFRLLRARVAASVPSSRPVAFPVALATEAGEGSESRRAA